MTQTAEGKQAQPNTPTPEQQKAFDEDLKAVLKKHKARLGAVTRVRFADRDPLIQKRFSVMMGQILKTYGAQIEACLVFDLTPQPQAEEPVIHLPR